MARFDVYKNPNGSGYLLTVQADMLESLNSRMVVPLMPLAEAPRLAQRLNPRFRIGDDDVVMVTQFMAAVPTSLLKTVVAALGACHAEIVDATDMLMQGF